MAEEQGNSGTSGKRVNGSETAGADGLDGRLRRLDAALSAHKDRAESGNKTGESAKTGFGQALKLSSEFVAGVLVGAGLGWVIDTWAGTSPWGLIVFLLLGFAAGVLNVLRSAGQVAEFGHRQDRK